jgi:RNA polymerase sigma-70 factor (ECF subfamily)
VGTRARTEPPSYDGGELATLPVGGGVEPASRVTPEEQALVRRILCGERGAFDELVREHHPKLMRVARSLVRDDGAAEEVVQETWKAVFQRLAAFEGRASLKSWMFRILTNQAKSRARRDRRFIPFSAFSDSGDPDEPAVDPSRFGATGAWADPPARWERRTPEHALLTREAMEVLDRALADLPVPQRAVVTMRDLAGLGSAEVCNVLEISEINQRVLLHRARSKLRRALERHFGPGWETVPS